jgi:hypothetical protein
MRVLGIDWKQPATSDWMWVWGSAAAGMAIGLAIHSVTHGDPHLVFAMGAAGAAAAALVASGADLDAQGWRGAAVTLAGAIAAFVATAALTTG